MQKIKSFFLSLIFSILGIAVGIGVGYLIVVFNEGGAFDSWKLLNSSFKFERIVDANSYIVWAESKNGKLLYYKDIKQTYCEDKDCNQWFETKEISSDAHLAYERPVEKDNSCQFDNLRFLRKPPEKLLNVLVDSTRVPRLELLLITHYWMMELYGNGIITEK